MVLFILEMFVYLGSLLATFAIVLFAAWKANSAGTGDVMAVVLLAPAACWSVAIFHWSAYNYAKARLPNLVFAILQYMNSRSSFMSEKMDVAAPLILVADTCTREVATVINRSWRGLSHWTIRRTSREYEFLLL